MCKYKGNEYCSVPTCGNDLIIKERWDRNGVPWRQALFLYHVTEVGAGLHQEWVDIPENTGRIGRLYLSHEVPDHRVAQEILGFGRGGGSSEQPFESCSL